MTTLKDIQGFEHDWLAQDADGRLALFTTAGGGWAPQQYLDNIASTEAAIRSVLSTLPTTNPKFAPILADDLPNDWVAFASRGFYCFDSDIDGSPYHLVAAPLVSRAVDGLPADVQRVLAKVVLLNVRLDQLALGEVVAPKVPGPIRPASRR